MERLEQSIDLRIDWPIPIGGEVMNKNPRFLLVSLSQAV